jgi:predicted nucleic acid-binding protein
MLLRLWSLEGARLLTSTYALEEARRNLDSDEQRTRLAELAAKVEVVVETSGELPDEARELAEKDKPILLAAIRSKATHLLTGDRRHFGKLYGKTIAGVLILPPNQYPSAASPMP